MKLFRQPALHGVCIRAPDAFGVHAQSVTTHERRTGGQPLIRRRRALRRLPLPEPRVRAPMLRWSSQERSELLAGPLLSCMLIPACLAVACCERTTTLRAPEQQQQRISCCDADTKSRPSSSGPTASACWCHRQLAVRSMGAAFCGTNADSTLQAHDAWCYADIPGVTMRAWLPTAASLPRQPTTT